MKYIIKPTQIAIIVMTLLIDAAIIYFGITYSGWVKQEVGLKQYYNHPLFLSAPSTGGIDEAKRLEITDGVSGQEVFFYTEYKNDGIDSGEIKELWVCDDIPRSELGSRPNVKQAWDGPRSFSIVLPKVRETSDCVFSRRLVYDLNYIKRNETVELDPVYITIHPRER